MELALPVYCGIALRADAPEPPENVLCSYFCLMNFSMTPSTSSTSIGMEGLAF